MAYPESIRRETDDPSYREPGGAPGVYNRRRPYIGPYGILG